METYYFKAYENMCIYAKNVTKATVESNRNYKYWWLDKNQHYSGTCQACSFYQKESHPLSLTKGQIYICHASQHTRVHTGSGLPHILITCYTFQSPCWHSSSSQLFSTPHHPRLPPAQQLHSPQLLILIIQPFQLCYLFSLIFCHLLGLKSLYLPYILLLTTALSGSCFSHFSQPVLQTYSIQ